MKVICARTGKNTFGTLGQAEQVAQSASERGLQTRPYRCQHCGFWHLTTKPWHRPRERAA
jgi:predicted Zn-ribbon and HTH transcriptional regulator